MKGWWILKGAGGHVQELTRPSARGRERETIHPVLTVQEACRQLRKSRRQVYRYLQTGRLQPLVRILGQWLFGPEEIRRFREERVPPFLRPFFWDVPLSSLSLGHHRQFILARLLEFGDWKAVRWAFHTYPKESLVEFLRDEGAGQLSHRAWNLWALQFGIRARRRKVTSLRQRGRHWGGIP